MRSFRRWVAAVAVALAGCGDGGIQSPDFTSVIALKGFDVEPEGSSLTVPAGTTLRLRALADFTKTLPPGSAEDGGADDDDDQVNGVLTSNDEIVTDDSAWSSGNEAIATVSRGLVTARSPGVVTITANYRDRTDSVQVTVSAATLQRIDHVRPVSVAKSPTNTYSVVAGNSVPFGIFGVFSDGSLRQIAEGPSVSWSSDDATVATNPAADPNDNVFGPVQLGADGSALITGSVPPGSGVAPNSAAATLNVLPFSEFCATQFLAPTAAVTTASSALCIGCDVQQPDLIIDSSAESFAVMSIPVGLLTLSNVSATVFTSGVSPLSVGQPTGFVVSRDSEPIISLELLSGLTIETLQCNAAGTECAVQESFDGETNALVLALLGMLDDREQALVSTPALTKPANGVRLIFDGGLLSALATVNVHSACGVATPPAAP